MNTDTSATVNYEDHLLLFPSFYRHLSQKDPKTGRPGPYGVGNDGLLDVRMLHGGSVSSGEFFDVEYTGARNARQPWVPLGVNRCAVSGSVGGNTTGGWCSQTGGDLARTDPLTSTNYMVHGFLLSSNGESVYQYVTGTPFTHAGWELQTEFAWKNNSAVERLVLRRDGEAACARSTCTRRCSPLRLRPGFVSVDGGYQGLGEDGTAIPSVTTVPLHVPRCAAGGDVRLKLNVITSVVGFVKVALLDAAGKSLPGFELANADAILGNFISRAASWGNGQRLSLGSVAGQQVALHMELADAQLFSVAFECQPPTANARVKSDDSSSVSSPPAGRSRVSMDLGWRFHRGDPSGLSNDTVAASGFDDSAWRLLNVPHDYVVEGNFSKGTGASKRDGHGDLAHGYLPVEPAWYRRTFHWPSKGAAAGWLTFDGVFHESDVWINGVHVQHHRSGYTGFEVVLTAIARPGLNTVALRCDPTTSEGWWYEGQSSSYLWPSSEASTKLPRRWRNLQAHLAHDCASPARRSAWRLCLGRCARVRAANDGRERCGRGRADQRGRCDRDRGDDAAQQLDRQRQRNCNQRGDRPARRIHGAGVRVGDPNSRG